jgi:redox-sensitive bicupin YhaK (pirin superfamily)
LNRLIKDHWYVQYSEETLPAIQKGWVLPVDKWADCDPFILMAEDWFKKGTFPDHPHRGFQTVTYVIDGRLEHIDNAGGRDILQAGDVQYMNAGWAARHAEDGVENDIVHTLQLWVNLPKEKKKTDTFYQNVYAEKAPVVAIPGGTLKVFSGSIAGITGPLQTIVPMTLTEINLEEGAEYIHRTPANHNAFLYVLSGDVTIGKGGDEEVQLNKHGVATFQYDETGDSHVESDCRLIANERRTKLLFYSGLPIKEHIVPYGPFVMNTMDEIKEAYRDYHDGKFGPPAI